MSYTHRQPLSKPVNQEVSSSNFSFPWFFCLTIESELVLLKLNIKRFYEVKYASVFTK